MLFGNDEQKRKYLPPAAAGEVIFSYALTEPKTGSDARHIRFLTIAGLLLYGENVSRKQFFLRRISNLSLPYPADREAPLGRYNMLPGKKLNKRLTCHIVALYI